MNKIIVVLVIATIILGSAYLFLNRKNITTTRDNDNNTPSPTVMADPDDPNVTSGPTTATQRYEIKSLLVRDPSNIHLYSNLQDRLPAPDAMVKNDCSDLVTAGFYTKDFKHIGLLISEYNRLSEEKPTLPSSGYFSINSDGIPSITLSPPTEARLAVQSYPVLYRNGAPMQIQDNTQDNARRIAVATTNDDDVVFLVFYKNNSVYEGPQLNELPELIQNFQSTESVKFNNVLNLDGGTHSAFISRFINLPELSTIGSYFCMRY